MHCIHGSQMIKKSTNDDGDDDMMRTLMGTSQIKMVIILVLQLILSKYSWNMMHLCQIGSFKIKLLCAYIHKPGNKASQ